ncbi:toll/interleukin-1 receptor domain-containing protein [Bradyrhizobium sp. SZCCHNR1015]|uniref:toll/interleukin-1 receptor domain-containing protein n=1 Tax=Bradyrhizobium sp. SZCCHNR1015 TaxID=3057338 RepID=UPI002916591D|nr:TIR domain-containing protein [Bradyrhizobium sp. SZCCHNR1015]
MYNLLVSSNAQAWTGEPWQIEFSRCVREYTENTITARFGALDEAAVSELKRLPCIFAYEAFNKLAPKFGLIRDIAKRQGQVRIEYELQAIDPFLSADDLEQLTFELDIGNWEMNRTHWAVKDVNLAKELHAARRIALPSWTGQATKTVDITRHDFDVALSFPGEVRAIVEQVARELEARIGPNSYFYDSNYVSQLARPSLDTLLQGIYRHRSRLIVVFLGSDYQRKDWCGIEFRAIREIIMERENARIMFVRTDDGAVDGVFKTDGYVDARRFSPGQIAQFICERLAVLSSA